MYEQKQLALTNFKKAHSYLSKIIEMAENDKYCVDLMERNLAIIGLLRSAHRHLMEGHLKGCFASAMITKNETKKEKMIQEILKVSDLYNR